MNYLSPPVRTPRSIEGIICAACEYSYVPAESFGCQSCGAHGEELVSSQFSGAGTLLQSVLVHMHSDETVPTPYAVGTVQLNEGPLLRVPVVGPGAFERPRSGQRGQLVTNPVPDTGAELVFEITDDGGEA